MPLPIPEAVDNATLPRQFACSIEPDPIGFLLPNGHQRATRSAYRTSLGKSYGVGLSARATTNWRGDYVTIDGGGYRTPNAREGWPFDTD